MGLGEGQGRNLIGRERQHAAASSHLQAGSGVLLAGGPGVGKTAFARALVDGLEADGDHAVQWLVAGAAGPAIPFGAFAPLAPEVGGDRTLGQDGFDLLQSLRRSVLARAGGRRLLLVVDDAHRLDEASATLVFQLVSAGKAAAVVTVRTGTPMPEGMRSLWKDGLLERFDLLPMGRDDTIALAADFLGGQPDGDLAQALWRLSRGNPLYLRELVSSGQTSGTVGAHHGVWRLWGALSAGPRLTELVQHRLARVGRNEMAIVELVAFGEPVPLCILTRLAPGAYVSSLQRQGLLVVESVDGEEQVRPSHPVYGEVIRAALPAVRANDLRIDLAAAFEAEGRLERDLLRVVSWRLDSGGHEDPALLLAASHRAAEQQDWSQAGRLAHAALTGVKEPGAAMALAVALGHQGRYEEALAVLVDWQGDGDDEAARAAVLRAHLLFWGLRRADEADAVLEAAEAAIADPSSRTRVAALRADIWTLRGRAHEAAAHIVALVQHEGLTPRALAAGRSALALAWGWEGRVVDAVELATSCLDPSLQDAGDAPGAMPWGVLADLLAHRLDGRLRDTEMLAASEYARAVSLHNSQAQGVAIGSLGWVSLAQGRLLRAMHQFRESVAVLDEADLTPIRSLSLAGLIESLAMAGDAQGAEAAVANMIDDTGAITVAARPCAAICRGWVSAARGELSRAVEQFMAAAMAARADGQVLFEILALHSAARLGEVQVAERLTEMATWVQGPIIQAAATQADAMATGSGAGLDRAADAWAGMTMWLHAAECSARASQAHLLDGSRRAAAASASRAEAFLDHCDGPRPRGPTVSLVAPTLTRREREVALLAETGLSSQAIAERLYLSVRTVDSHLARIYTKLGITGRRELTAARASLSPR